MKWLRGIMLLSSVCVSYLFFFQLGLLSADDSPLSGILAVLLFILVLMLTTAVLFGVSVLIGAIVSIIRSILRNLKNRQELRALGSPELLRLDNQRLRSQVLTLVSRVLLTFFVLAFILALNLYTIEYTDSYLGNNKLTAFTAIGLVIAIAIWFWSEQNVKLFSERFKERIVLYYLQESFAKVDYRPMESLAEYQVRASCLFSDFDAYTGDDYLSAEFKGHSFQQSDLRLTQSYQTTDSDGDSVNSANVVFTGCLMILSHNAIVKEPVFIHDKRVYSSTAGITTGNNHFDQHFTVTTTDISALQTLTPAVLNGIIQANERIAFPISISFIADRIYVALYGLNTFEATIAGDETLSEQRRRVIGEIQIVLEMVAAIGGI